MLSRYSLPLSPLSELRREMDRLFDEFGLGSWRLPSDTAPYPALNIWDDGDAFCVEAELPGSRQEDIEVYAVGNELTIKGCRLEPEGPPRTYHRQERGTGQFARVVTLPAEVDAEKVEASLKDGVLTLRLPKAETARPRKIVVKTK